MRPCPQVVPRVTTWLQESGTDAKTFGAMPRPSLSVVISSFLLVLCFYYFFKTSVDAMMGSDGGLSTASVVVPADLEARIHRQFESLLEHGLIAYQPSDVELFEKDGFQVWPCTLLL